MKKTVHGETANTDSQCAQQMVRFSYLTVFVLLTIGFFYASWIPFVFAANDLPTRVAGMFNFKDWHTVSDLLSDTMLNLIGFFPIGFVGGALCDVTSQRRRSGLRTFGIAACLSLGIAIGAEGLQLFIPPRTASFRDILTLETGALLGTSFWCAVGNSATAFVSRRVTPIARWGGRSIFRYRWLGLFSLLFVACLSLNLYASPGELYWAYSRHTWVNQARMNADYVFFFKVPRAGHSFWTASVASLVSSACVVATCKLVDKALPAGRTRQTLHVAHDGKEETGSKPSYPGGPSPQ
jgi:hypothetical protein